MKLSIITINYNNEHGLQQTIDSVIQQTFKDFEYIIIDGGSNDGSIDIIKQYTNKLSYWVSEKDKGIYHAMNKGIVKAKGEYLLMLNSGDYLINSSVLSEVFENNIFTEDILYGEIEWQNNGHFVINSNFPIKLSFEYFWQKSIGHQAAFIKKQAHDLVSLYDESLKITADWKFFLLAFQKYKLSFRHLPFFVTAGDNTGVSWNSANFSMMKKEQATTIRTYFKEDYKAYCRFRQKNRPPLKNRLIMLKLQLQQKYKQNF